MSLRAGRGSSTVNSMPNDFKYIYTMTGGPISRADYWAATLMVLGTEAMIYATLSTDDVGVAWTHASVFLAALLGVNILRKRFQALGLPFGWLVLILFWTLKPLQDVFPDSVTVLHGWAVPLGKLVLLLLVVGAGLPRDRSGPPAPNPA